jgi:gamma-glutamyltranspeptidase / glutathione hydrolase
MFSDAMSLKFREQKFRTSSNSVDHFVEFWEHPPNGQDIVALIALGVLEELELTDEIPTFGPQDKNSV